MSDVITEADRLQAIANVRRAESEWTRQAHVRYWLWRVFGYLRTNELARFQKRKAGQR